MNITQSASGSNTNVHEVSLRTMASDISSLERGSQTPTSIHLTAKSDDPIPQDAVKVPKQEFSVFRFILALLFLAAVGIGMYIYVYPYITGKVR